MTAAADRRTKSRVIRMSEAEDRDISRLAAAVSMSVSDYLRTAGRYGRPQAAPPLSIEAIRELNRIGVNLNQIARRLNAMGQLESDELTRCLKRLNAMLDKATGHGAAND